MSSNILQFPLRGNIASASHVLQVLRSRGLEAAIEYTKINNINTFSTAFKRECREVSDERGFPIN